tara:strand:- start:8396 stop:8791 length:396 start_codon:yes stop_codon:yes gene_type:complete
MKKRSKWKYLIIGVLVLVVLGLLFILFSGGSNISGDEVDAFAKCLTDNGAVMYGTFWCPHCSRTKKKFGPSFIYINYVECDPRGENEKSELCIEKEIGSYDTWEFLDGSRLIGEPSFQQMGERTGCPVPLE